MAAKGTRGKTAARRTGTTEGGHAIAAGRVPFSRCEWTSAEGFRRGVAALRLIRDEFADVISGDLRNPVGPKPRASASTGATPAEKRASLNAELDEEAALSAAFHDAVRFARSNPDCGIPALADATEPSRPDPTTRQRLLYLMLDFPNFGPGRDHQLKDFLRNLDTEVASWHARGLFPQGVGRREASALPEKDRAASEQPDASANGPRTRSRFEPEWFTGLDGTQQRFDRDWHILATEVTDPAGLGVPGSTFWGWKQQRQQEKRPALKPIGWVGNTEVFDRPSVMLRVDVWRTRKPRPKSR